MGGETNGGVAEGGSEGERGKGRGGCNVPDLASLGNTANVCVGSKVYSI
jgi:hypothetical protein